MALPLEFVVSPRREQLTDLAIAQTKLGKLVYLLVCPTRLLSRLVHLVEGKEGPDVHLFSLLKSVLLCAQGQVACTRGDDAA